MKKILIIFMIFGFLIMNVPQAYAISISDLQKEIEILKQEVASLKSQITGSVLGAVSSVTYSLGMKSPDLIKYQQALIDQKYLGSGNATGVFGLQTYNAVKNFQLSKGLKADGVLGVVTQSKLLGTDYTTSLDGPELACLPNSWLKISDFSGASRFDAVGFSINGKGYVGTGVSDGYSKKDFWEYNTDTNTWTQKADFGGGTRTNATSFTIGGQGYVGTGWGSNNYFKDFWEYNPVSNTWTQKSDFGGEKRNFAVSFSVENKGYIVTGGNNNTSPIDLWEYNPITDTWTKKADFGGRPRTDAVGFSINGKGYVGTGWDSNTGGTMKDFWEYNPITDTWTKKADFLGGLRYQAVGFGFNGKGYIGTGRDTQFYTGYKKDFWEYDPSTDKWIQKSDFKGGERVRSVGFSINNKGYLGTGGIGNNNQKDFWMYCPGQSN